MSQRSHRGTLPPLITALAVTTAFALPAYATVATAASAAPAAQSGQEWWLTSLNAPGAWRYSYGSGITVAVLSTGVNPTQPGLAGDVIIGPDYSMSGRSAGGPFWGTVGTAVAGVIAGHGRGAGTPSGITGIAPAAKILSLRVTLEYNDPLNSDAAITRRLPDAIASGITYAVSHGARVIALPLDPGTLGVDPPGDPAAAGGSPAERAAVSYALGKGVVLVAPAGDDGEGTGTINFPAAYPGVLAVGAIGRNGGLAPFTNKHSYVLLTAPGAGMAAALPPDGYTSISTTDVASALTAGVAALIRSRFPGLTVAQVTRALEQSTAAAGRATPGPAGTGYGVLNAGRALQAAATMATVQPRPAPVPTKRPASRGGRARVTDLGSQKGNVGAVSVLRDALIGVGVLIIALLSALLLSRSRRQRRNASRFGDEARRTGSRTARGRNAPRGSHAIRSDRKARQAAAADAGRDDPWRSVRVTNGTAAPAHGTTLAVGRQAPVTAGRPVVAPLARTPTGSVGGRTGRRADPNAGNPPWEAAPMPEEGVLSLPLTSLPLTSPRQSPPASGGPGAPGADPARAPWEDAGQDPGWEAGQFAAAPVPADLPDWGSADTAASANTGPMYVWNPVGDDFPAITDEDGPAQ